MAITIVLVAVLAGASCGPAFSSGNTVTENVTPPDTYADPGTGLPDGNLAYLINADPAKVDNSNWQLSLDIM